MNTPSHRIECRICGRLYSVDGYVPMSQRVCPGCEDKAERADRADERIRSQYNERATPQLPFGGKAP